MKKYIAGIIAALALVATGFIAAQLWNNSTQPTLTLSATTIQEQLTQSSELTTAKLEYRGLVTYEEGDIDFITKKKFSMIYDAEIRTGVDLSQATVTVNAKTVTVTLPQAELQAISVDANSLEFYDEQLALFNWQNRTDTAEALKLAEEDAKNKIDQTSMLEEANNQANLVVENFLRPFTEGEEGYQLNIIQA